MIICHDRPSQIAEPSRSDIALTRRLRAAPDLVDVLQSLTASIVLPILMNVLPRLFPSATREADRQIHYKMEEALEDSTDGTQGRDATEDARVFLWKAVLIVSLVLTVLVNLSGNLVWHTVAVSAVSGQV